MHAPTSVEHESLTEIGQITRTKQTLVKTMVAILRRYTCLAAFGALTQLLTVISPKAF